MTEGQDMPQVERHHWRCDCEECWIGLTNTPQPPSLWKRIYAKFRKTVSHD